MSETISLHCQEAPFSQKLNEEERMVANYLVTAVEMADGRFIKGHDPYDDQPTMTMSLSWEWERAERIADFYTNYLAKESRPTDGWNCHKFVVDAMGWKVLWSEQAHPYYLNPGFIAVETSVLRDQTPYVIKGKMEGIGFLTHSMLGLPDPDYTLGVDGRNAGLWIAPHSTVAAKYGSKICRQYPPIVQRLGKAGRIFQPLKAAETFPL